MAKKDKTNWKKVQSQQEHPGVPSGPWNGNPPAVTAPPPREILAQGTRSSTGKTTDKKPASVGEILSMLEGNRRKRRKIGLKGLFGGGD